MFNCSFSSVVYADEGQKSAFDPDECRRDWNCNYMVNTGYGVTFASGSAEMDERIKKQLKKIQKWFQTHPDTCMWVVGSPDRGDSDRALSQERANAAQAFFVTHTPG